MSSHQVKTYVSILDNVEVVWCFFHDVFSGVACVDDSFIVCGIVDFVCSYGWSICFQWCSFDSGHGSIAFLLQQGAQFGIGVGKVMRYFLVLKLTQEWGVKS